MKYAMIRDETVAVIGEFTAPPTEEYKRLTGYDAYVEVPEDLPVSVGCLYRGGGFLSPDGRDIEPLPEPEEGEEPTVEELLGILNARIGVLTTQGAAIAQASTTVPVATVGVFAEGFEEWVPGTKYEKQYSLFTYGGKVGFTRQANVTAYAHQPPFSTGMESVYGVRPIPDDRGIYPYAYNMAASTGMKVREGDTVYECTRDIDPLLYPPSQVPGHFEKE